MKDSLVTIDFKKCGSCTLCAKVCPMQLNPGKCAINGVLQFGNLDCIRCKTCIFECPSSALSMEPRV